MSDIAIRVENLGKAYKIAHNAGGSRYKTLQEDVIGLLKRPFSREGRSTSEIFWALKDISFEVKQGEVLGIIGRNGAGKSTLLKILSRIARPTTGYAEMYGRIGSLLEVGTGFHPELTGRENIFLNGAVLGMSRRDIQRQFDEIVAFAEVEQFLDTPVKRYSSGMYMRLAFAVAAHLEPEILIVDEVLAVGDAEFQKKSLGKMGEVAKSGRTVLFVSHNMAAVEALCSNSILIDQGSVKLQEQTKVVIRQYLISNANNTTGGLITPPAINKSVSLLNICLYNDSDTCIQSVDSQDRFGFELHYEVIRPINQLSIWLRLVNELGINVVYTWIQYEQNYLPGHYIAKGWFPKQLFTPGGYYVDVGAEHYRVEIFHYAQKCFHFEIIDSMAQHDVTLGGWGIIQPVLNWVIYPA